MSEHPILFNSEMVRAILDGQKTQTRRVIKMESTPAWEVNCLTPGRAYFRLKDRPDIASVGFDCPYGKPGDVLWVREKWQPLYDYCNEAIGIVGACFRHMGGGRVFNNTHRPSMHIDDTHKFKPSIHMPKWACRLRLIVKNIRVERVQDITAEDCIAEGIVWDKDEYFKHELPGLFRNLWNRINSTRGFGWFVNPWVWCVEFEKE